MTPGSNIALRIDAPPDRAVHQVASEHRLRPLFAMVGLVLIATALLFGIALSSPAEQPDALMLLSCGPCHG